MHTTTRIAAVAAVAGIAALGLAACSSSPAPAADTASAIATVAPTALRSADTLSICTTNLGSPPNISTDESGNLIGSEIDLAKAVAGRLGLAPDFVTVDFAALIPSLQAKQCDVIMAQLYIKPEREKVVDFVPYVMSGTGIAVSKEHPAAITGLDDSLCGKKVILAVATTAEALAQEQSEKCTAAGKAPVDITRSNQADVSIQQVQNGQVDAFMDTAETLGYYATKTGARIQSVGEPFGTIQIGAATLKGNTALHDALAGALSEVESNGTYGKILDEWGMSDLSIES